MRTRICLNGEWKFMPDFKGTSPLEMVQNPSWESELIRVPSSWRFSFNLAQDFQPYDLFNYPREWNEANLGILGRNFYVHIQECNRYFLILKGVLQQYIVFINQQPLIESTESYLPVELDITSFIHEGENELAVWCGPYQTIETPYGKKALTPTGSWFASLNRGIWQDIFLETRPEIFLEDIFVKTSTRLHEIQLQTEIHNLSAQPLNCQVNYKVFDGTNPDKNFHSFSVEISPGQKVAVDSQEPWNDPILWSPENPHLYQLMAELEIDDKIFDRLETRFGFREVWLEGHQFILNGVRLNFRGDAWHYQGFVQQNKEYAQNWYRMCQETGINLVRLHAMPYPEFYLDAADEMGMLIIDESAIYGSGKAIQADHPTFIKNCTHHLRALIRRDRNHPSVVIWSMQNEMRWVDGRDGYKTAMKRLTQVMKNLDDTRPVSYDGDNRLVDLEDMEIVSMHYNIDGTVSSWHKDKPLIFGEHGPWHYVSPQTCCDLAGSFAYLSFDACQESMGLNESLFNEYARKEEVTGLTPFNTANYNMWTMPDADIHLEWDDLTTPGPKPRSIPAHSLTINNGMVKDQPGFLPNPSWKYLDESFKPVVLFRNDYDQQFFGNQTIQRSFSIYNDTESSAQACLKFSLKDHQGRVYEAGDWSFSHPPGIRVEWIHDFFFPGVGQKDILTLSLELFHGELLVHQLDLEYQIFSEKTLESLILPKDAVIGFYGGQEELDVVAEIAGSVRHIPQLDEATLAAVDVLVLGKNISDNPVVVQPILGKFVQKGGFLIILEQNFFSIGDLSLSGKRFFSAFITDNSHPIFKGITDLELRFWDNANIHASDENWLVQNAFLKPSLGDFKILLECGQGNFGWGGLLWTPMVEYTIGKGTVLFNQVEILSNLRKVPIARILLQNILQYGLDLKPKEKFIPGLLAESNSTCGEFLKYIGVELELISPASQNSTDFSRQVILVDPQALNDENLVLLVNTLHAGGNVFVLPSVMDHSMILSRLAGEKIIIESCEVYQLQPLPGAEARGIPISDLFLIESVTYSPAGSQNTILCQYDIKMETGKIIFEAVHNPWVDYFVRGLDAEYLKVAVATLSRNKDFHHHSFAVVKEVGKGKLVLSQVLLLENNEKIRRVYTRMLSNLGVRINTSLFDHPKAAQDYSNQSFMGLRKEPYQN